VNLFRVTYGIVSDKVLRIVGEILNTGMNPFPITLINRFAARSQRRAYHATHMPVHCYDLSPALLGSMCDQEVADRRHWCTQNCQNSKAETSRTHVEGHPSYVFWIENYTDAAVFKLRWSPVATPPDEAP
jgi:hypothetical protein